MPPKKNTDKKAKKKGKASAILPDSPAKNYESPQLHTVATKVVVESEAFIPQYAAGSSCVNLMANLEPDHSGVKKVTLPHRATVQIDCGVSIELPAGYRAVVKALPELANIGLIVNDGPHVIDESNHGKVKVTVTNVGKQIIVINDGDPVAQMYVEPVYLFDWVI